MQGSTLLVWDKRYDNLPGRCHVEVGCEALLARLPPTRRANLQCKSLDTACGLFLFLKATCSDEKNLHDRRIQRSWHEYVDGNLHNVVERLLTDTIRAVMWDHNETVTTSAAWPANFAYRMALSTPLRRMVYANMVTVTLYTLTGPVTLSEDSVGDLTTHFSKYPPRSATAACSCDTSFSQIRSKGKQTALAQSQNRPQQQGSGENGPLPPFRPRALNLVRAAVLSDGDFDADTYVGDDVLPVHVGLDLLSVHSLELTQVGNHVLLE